MLYVTHPSSVDHDPRALSPNHPDSPARIEATEAAIAGSTLAPLTRLSAPAANQAQLRLVHTTAQIVTPRVASHFGHVWVL